MKLTCFGLGSITHLKFHVYVSYIQRGTHKDDIIIFAIKFQCMAPMHLWILYFHTQGHDAQLSKCENGEKLNSFFHFLNSSVVIDLFYYSKHAIELCIGLNSICANNIWCNIFFSTLY
jgi:hypothetical protein